MVGAGGIGCELLKNCVLAGIGDITIVRRVDSPRRADIAARPRHDRPVQPEPPVPVQQVTRQAVQGARGQGDGEQVQPARQHHRDPRQHQGRAVRRRLLPVVRHCPRRARQCRSVAMPLDDAEARRRATARQQDVHGGQRTADRVGLGRLQRPGRADQARPVVLLRLLAQGDAQDVPRLHDPEHAEHADPLHRLGQELPVPAALRPGRRHGRRGARPSGLERRERSVGALSSPR